MAKKKKEIVQKSDETMAVLDAQLTRLEADWKVGTARRWVILPTADKLPSGKVMTRRQMLEALRAARAVLDHDTWGEALNEARRISEIGGIGQVGVHGVKHRMSQLDCYENGRSTTNKRLV